MNNAMTGTVVHETIEQIIADEQKDDVRVAVFSLTKGLMRIFDTTVTKFREIDEYTSLYLANLGHAFAPVWRPEDCPDIDLGLGVDEEGEPIEVEFIRTVD